MVIRNDDYRIEGDGIWLSKALLESYRDHYPKMADAHKKDSFLQGFYFGEAQVVFDILKMFEPLEG